MTAPIGPILLIAIVSVFLMLDFVVVGLRLWARHIKRKALELSDYMILIGLVRFQLSMFSILSNLSCLVAFHRWPMYLRDNWYDTQHPNQDFNNIICTRIYHRMRRKACYRNPKDTRPGTSHHKIICQGTTSSPYTNLSDPNKTAYGGAFMWNGASTSIKISILDFYITIFRNSKIRRIAYNLMGICSIIFLAFTLLLLLICRPLPYFWEKSIKGCCGDIQLTLLIPSIVNLALYLLILSLPMPLLWELQVTNQKKLQPTWFSAWVLCKFHISNIRRSV